MEQPTIDWQAISKRAIEIATSQRKAIEKADGGIDPHAIELTGDVDTALLEY